MRVLLVAGVLAGVLAVTGCSSPGGATGPGAPVGPSSSVSSPATLAPPSAAQICFDNPTPANCPNLPRTLPPVVTMPPVTQPVPPTTPYVPCVAAGGGPPDLPGPPCS